METIYLTSDQITKLKPLKIDKKISYGEASFYESPNNDNIIYKIYDAEDSGRLLQKEKTVIDLMSNKKEIAIPELVLPKATIRINNRFKGIGIEHIHGTNLSVYLSSNNIPLDFKIKLLKQLGTILQKIKNANPKLNLAYGDVHEDNFIFNGETLYGIDTDGIRINNNPGRVNFFFSSPIMYQSKKYPFGRDYYAAASTDTDLFCFIMMILKIVSNENEIYRISLDDYKRYLDYLASIGFDTKLLECFASIYDPNIDNIDPTPYLDSLNQISKKTHLSTMGGIYL